MKRRGLALLLVVAAAALVVLERRGREDAAAAPNDFVDVAASTPAPPVELDGATPIELAPDETRTVAEVEPPPKDVERASAVAAPADPGPVGCVLYGRATVADAAMKPAAKLWVAVTDSAGERRQSEVGEQGDYSLTGLAPGEWQLDVKGDGYRGQQEALTLTTGVPLVRRDFVLERAVVLPVRVVTAAGVLLRDALKESGKYCPSEAFPIAVATLEEPGPTIAEATDLGSDRFGVGNFWTSGALLNANPGSIGVLTLTCDLPVFVSLLVGTRVHATQRVEPGANEVVFVLEVEELLAATGKIHVRFVGADDGEPLIGWMQIEPVNMMYSSEETQWELTLPPGHHTLLFRAKGHACVPQVIDLGPGDEIDLGDVALPRELMIGGRLVDPDGNPVARNLMLGRRDANGGVTFEETTMYKAKPSGEFTIYGLLPGHYVLRTYDDDGRAQPGADRAATIWVSGNVSVSTFGGSVTGLELHLVKAGTVVLERAMESGAAGCRILDAQDDPLRAHRFSPGFVPRFALPPGPCTLVLVDADGKELERRPLDVDEGVTEVDLAGAVR